MYRDVIVGGGIGEGACKEQREGAKGSGGHGVHIEQWSWQHHGEEARGE